MDPVTAISQAIVAICHAIEAITEANTAFLEGMTPEQREKHHDRLQRQFEVAEAFWKPLTDAVLRNSQPAKP